MLRSFFLLFAVITIFSCRKPTGVKNLLLTTDSSAIVFYKGNGSIDSVIHVVILRDKKQLESLAGFIESGQTDNNNCGYDGSLHFFKADKVVQDVYFRMNQPGCMHFSFSLEGKVFQTKLNDDAKNFLQLQMQH